MDTAIELQRQLHEEVERLMAAMVEEMSQQNRTTFERIQSEHRVKAMSEQVTQKCKQIADLYADKDGMRNEELVKLTVGANDFYEFNNRLKAVRDSHRLGDQGIAEPMKVEAGRITVDFTGEEGNGRYLDLHELYDQYVNLKQIARVDYLEYVQTFDRLELIPVATKKIHGYSKYLENLLSYLTSFYSRIKPLSHLDDILGKAEAHFEEQWAARTFKGWIGYEEVQADTSFDITAYSSLEELERLGLEGLKAACLALGLKCGGTLRQRAERLMAAKGGVGMDKARAPAAAGSTAKSIASLEAKIFRLCELLANHRAATRENVERKQARTAEELAMEKEEEEGEEDQDGALDEDSSDDDTPASRNYKNIPLGWDGKPIPYWLYKLHGLNIKYPCEICGGHVYLGPKNFQRHFSEYRHANGMRALGIPNTAHFANITQIEDARTLWSKLKGQKGTLLPQQTANDEEFEDSHGNVVSRKTYEDLLRQGLL